MRTLVAALIGTLIAAPPAVVLGSWIADRGQTTELISMKVPRPVRPGGQMEVEYQINRLRICDRLIRREIIDGENNLFTLGVQAAPVFNRGGRYEYTQIVSIPPGARPGLGRYSVWIYDRCNPVQQWWPLVSSRSAEILIAEPPRR
jgi:hypothetical protein